MRIFIDGKRFDSPRQTDAMSVLGAVTSVLNEQQRALRQMLVDDVLVDDDWIQALDRSSVNSNVSFVSVPVAQLIGESIDNLTEALPQLSQELKQIVDDLQVGQDEQAFALIARSVDNLQSYMQLLNLLSVYASDLAENVQKQIEFLAHWLQEFMVAWQGEDMVLMADILLYEIEPSLQRGRHWLQSVPTAVVA
ncbi:MAG: hypothetical protein KDD84_15395 [Caldilineaceae bacterium]|nr:hypothetical protein [Caldilineaceae bacterium]